MGKRLVILFLATGAILLSACDDITSAVKANADANLATAQGQAAQGEAERLAAETTRAQAAAQARTTQALIDEQNAHTNDLRAMVIGALVLAALATALTFGMFLLVASRDRTPQPQIVYQITAPAPQQAQIGTPASWPEIRAKQRAVAQLQARNTERYKI